MNAIITNRRRGNGRRRRSDGGHRLRFDPEAIRAGRQGLLPGLAVRAVAREPLDDGYRLTFNPAPDIIGLIGRVIDAERQCCPWLTFTLKVAAGAGPIELQLHGPTGAREFLAVLFEL